MIELTDTSASEIANEFVHARRRAGSPAMGMVMTLVIVAEEDEAEDAMDSARAASREHPARVLAVVRGDGRGSPRIDAQVGIGEGWGGENATIRLRGEVVKHAESVVMPLLLPDSPVVVWWAGNPPDSPAEDPLGSLAQRRITDVAAVTRGKAKAMVGQCATYAPGNSDLAWTRITPWRAVLAASLDQHPAKVTAASVTAERVSPSADLLAAWLADRLRVKVGRHSSNGPGITRVVMSTAEGDTVLARADGRLATLSSPNQPDRPVALKRRDIPELLSEELRRLDEDDIYAATAKKLAKLGVDRPGGTARGSSGGGGAGRGRSRRTDSSR